MKIWHESYTVGLKCNCELNNLGRKLCFIYIYIYIIYITNYVDKTQLFVTKINDPVKYQSIFLV